MKLSWGFFVSSLSCAASAAQQGSVYIFDPVPKTYPRALADVDASTARLILAQRLGLSRFHSVELASSEESLQQIDVFGGQHQKLFGDKDGDQTQAHALIWLEGVEDNEAVIKNPEIWSSSFAITNPPPASDNKHLIDDMIMQAQSVPQKSDPKAATYRSNKFIDSQMSELRQPELINDYLTVLHIDFKSKDKMAKPSLNALGEMISSLLSASPKEIRSAVTLVIMPPSSSNSKRRQNPYGSYDRPSLEARRELTEAPMSLVSPEPATSSKIELPSDLEDFPVVAMAEGNNTTPPLGILPRCFESESACTKATNGCSGHGTCGVLRKSKEKGASCYACMCKPTVVDRGDTGMEQHKKTTYWGGPACQKKDVSIPFWLFVTSGVLFAFLISGGIGLLYSVGSEELPSVIGAGVSGPTRK